MTNLCPRQGNECDRGAPLGGVATIDQAKTQMSHGYFFLKVDGEHEHLCRLVLAARSDLAADHATTVKLDVVCRAFSGTRHSSTYESLNALAIVLTRVCHEVVLPPGRADGSFEEKQQQLARILSKMSHACFVMKFSEGADLCTLMPLDHCAHFEGSLGTCTVKMEVLSETPSRDLPASSMSAFSEPLSILIRRLGDYGASPPVARLRSETDQALVEVTQDPIKQSKGHLDELCTLSPAQLEVDFSQWTSQGHCGIGNDPEEHCTLSPAGLDMVFMEEDSVEKVALAGEMLWQCAGEGGGSQEFVFSSATP